MNKIILTNISSNTCNCASQKCIVVWRTLQDQWSSVIVHSDGFGISASPRNLAEPDEDDEVTAPIFEETSKATIMEELQHNLHKYLESLTVLLEKC